MSSMLKQLADKLERDIRGRGLLPGNKYQTGEEIARSLGTSVATANRALKLLAEQDIVVRSHRSGTFIGPALARRKTTDIRMVTILCPASERVSRTISLDPLIDGLLSNMPDVADVRVGYVPAEGDVDFVRDLLEPSQLEGRVAGVVAISCSYPVYQYLDEAKLPLVVMGSLYPGQSMPSIDSDEKQCGYLLTQYLLSRGHRRLALISASESRPGEHHFHDGVCDALTDAKMPPDALLSRTPRPERELLEAEVRELLAQSEPPTGFIVKIANWVPFVTHAIQIAGRRVPEDVDVVSRPSIGGSHDDVGCVLRPRASNRDVALLVGRMLAQARQHVPLEQNSVVIPFEFCDDKD
jgi:LacI family transcriptional regulator